MEKITENKLEELGLINFDDTVVSYIEKNISYPFDSKGNAIKTNVLITKPERWSELQRASTSKNKLDGNHLNLPVITIYRSGGDLTKNIIPHWVDMENLNIPAGLKRKSEFSEKFTEAELVNKIPLSINITYDINIISGVKEHNDHLLEQFIQHKDKYWKLGNYPFEAKFSSFIDNSDSADQNQERIISSSITMELIGYVRPKQFKNKPSEKNEIKLINKITFSEVEIDNISDIEYDQLFN